MSYTPNSGNMRVPQHLNEAELRQALDELGAKIKTLQNRAHATTAHSENHYHEHIAALEVKRAKLAAQLNPAPSPDAHDSNTWDEIRRGIDHLREDLHNLL